MAIRIRGQRIRSPGYRHRSSHTQSCSYFRYRRNETVLPFETSRLQTDMEYLRIFGRTICPMISSLSNGTLCPRCDEKSTTEITCIPLPLDEQRKIIIATNVLIEVDEFLEIFGIETARYSPPSISIMGKATRCLPVKCRNRKQRVGWLAIGLAPDSKCFSFDRRPRSALP